MTSVKDKSKGDPALIYTYYFRLVQVLYQEHMFSLPKAAEVIAAVKVATLPGIKRIVELCLLSQDSKSRKPNLMRWCRAQKSSVVPTCHSL